jgi:hypothetical protein
VIVVGIFIDQAELAQIANVDVYLIVPSICGFLLVF